MINLIYNFYYKYIKLDPVIRDKWNKREIRDIVTKEGIIYINWIDVEGLPISSLAFFNKRWHSMCGKVGTRERSYYELIFPLQKYINKRFFKFVNDNPILEEK